MQGRGVYVSGDIVELHESMEVKEDRVLSNPSLAKTILSHVRNGGTVIELARLLGVRFSSLMGFIRDDSNLSKLYNEATVDRAEWYRQTVFNQLRDFSTADTLQAFDDEGNLKPISEWPHDLRNSIESMEVKGDRDDKESYIAKFKTVNKIKAVELLGKTESLFAEKVKIEQTLTLEDLVGGSMEKDKDGR